MIIYCFLFFKHEILDPVSLIDEKAKAFRESSHLGDVDKYLLNIGASDEMGAHINGYNDLVKSIDKYIKEIQEISRENDRINFELSVATGMRMDMLPRLTPSSIDREGYSIFARLEPSLESGGAFYDYFYLEDDVIAAFSAVVEGSGVPAALFMVIAKILMKNHLQNGMSVDDVLDVTNNQLCEGNNAALFISAWVGIFNTTTGIFEYSSASHPEPLIISSNGDFRRVTPVKQSVPLGAWEDTPYEAYTDKLKAGDLFVLFNEGIVEATNNDSEEEFGIERLIGGICINYPKEVETINNEMYKEWTDFVGPNKEKYDFSLLMVKINE